MKHRLRPSSSRLALFALLGLLPLASAQPDEGMWTFDAPPREALKERYDFEPTKEWLEHVRLASVRVNDGGSGSFISPEGLVLTNHHVGFTAIQKLSTEERDLITNGFHAATRADELPCTDLELNVLESTEDVTARVRAAVETGGSEAEALERKDAAIATIEKEAADATGLRCNVIELYRGGKYVLYRYKKYTDVRLVFAPDQQAAFFGGDPDNFTFPRFCLDMAIFRVYEDGRPAATPHYFEWNAEGAQEEGELVFVSGNPGSTGRLLTVSQLEYLRDERYPHLLRSMERRIAALRAYAARGSEEERRARRGIFGIENGLKAVAGYHASLMDETALARKADEERKLRLLVEQDDELKGQAGEAWEAIARAQGVAAQLGKRAYYDRIRGSQLFSIAQDIVRMVAELEKPNEERLRPYRDSNLESLELSLFSKAPIYLDLEEVVLTAALEEIAAELGADDPLVKAIHGANGGPVEASFRVEGSQLVDPDYRRSLAGGGMAAVEACDDPVVRLALAMDPIARELSDRVEQEVDLVESTHGKSIAMARFAAYGSSVYPDATFTLRLSLGTVQGFHTGGYTMPYKTTFHGLYERAAAFDNEDPWTLSERWAGKEKELELTTPFNFVSTCDIIGGNSGSPVIDREARLVGLIFDGNIESLGNRFVFDDTVARSVAVHTGGMLAAMRDVYGAEALVEEILAAAK